MLDAFCYSGGFGLHAARAGAKEVIGVDASEPALALARENATLNQLDNLTFLKADVFDDLDERVQARRAFGLIVLGSAQVSPGPKGRSRKPCAAIAGFSRRR